MLQRITHNFKLFIYRLAAKDFDISLMTKRSLSIKKSQISCFPLSANTIKVLNIDGNVYFFRECLQHTDINSYLRLQIKCFFSYARQGCSVENFKEEIPIKTKFDLDAIESFKNYIKKREADEGFYGQLNQCIYELKNINFSIWHGRKDIPVLSLEKMGMMDVPENITDILPYFFTFISGAITAYNFNRHLKKGYFENFFATRSIGSSIIARLLGLDNLLTSAELVKIDVGDRVEFGVLSNKASGTRAMDSKMPISPKLQKSLMDLNLLDILCYQKDHGINNYNIVGDEHNIAVSVCAFDNDNMWTFFVDPRISFVGQCKSPIIKDGRINRPHISRFIADRILSVKDADIRKELSPYLNNVQLWALCKRLHKLKKYIIKTKRIDSNFILDDEQWNDVTIAEELSGDYGKTYLSLYKEHLEKEIKK